MADSKEPLFDLESHDQAESAEYVELREALQDHIDEFLDNHEIRPAILALLLIDLGIASRVADYLLSVEKPSGSGLRMELDRLRRDIDEFVRDARKKADEIVRASKETLAEPGAAGPE